MNRLFSRLGRTTYFIVAMFFAVLWLLPFLHGTADAIGQITNRSIQMSSSAAGNTGTQYTVSFKVATTSVVEGVIINFCDDSPLPGISCGWTSGQSIVTSGATLTSVSGTPDTTVGASNWKIVTDASSASAGNGVILEISDASATESGSSVTSGTTITIVFASITNPNYTSCTGGTVPNCSFYGRLFTANTTSITSYTATSIGANIVDDGGVALSTAAQINITAKVQETLAFCVFNKSGSCGTAPTFNLGNTNGVLSTSGPFVDVSTEYTIQTNAGNGVAINMQGNTLKYLTNSIAALTTAAQATAGGTSQFGLCTWQQAGTTITPISTSATATYSGTASSGTSAVACSLSGGNPLSQTSGTGSTGGAGSGATAPLFYFGSNISTTYGDEIASAVAGASATGEIGFVGNISASQTAGIYTTTLGLIANATY